MLWNSGRHCPKSFPRPAPNVVGVTRRRMSWIRCLNVCTHEPKKPFTRSGWPSRMRAFEIFLEVYGAKYPRVCECLSKDRDKLLTFYDLPAEHWIQMRTTNPIGSVFATVSLRHRCTKGNGTRARCSGMVPPLMFSGSKRWRLLKGTQLLTTSSREINSSTESKQHKTPPTNSSSTTIGKYLLFSFLHNESL